jgi:hypothetical protein
LKVRVFYYRIHRVCILNNVEINVKWE